MKSLKLIVFIAFIFVGLFAQDVTLYRVNIEGNTTTSDKMIKYSAGLRDGTKIQRADISTAITRLWDLGLFNDITIVLNNESQYGVEITINVVENPVLNNIIFDGISIREGRIKDVISIRQGQRIKINSLDEASRSIIDLYKEDGYYDISVIPSIVAPKDTVVRTEHAKDILFLIKENKKYRLSSIDFVGNNQFSQRKLRKELNNTKERKWWTFWVKNFDKNRLKEDIESLTNFYNNQGFRDFRVLSETIEVDKNNSTLSLILKIDEGPKYKYSKSD